MPSLSNALFNRQIGVSNGDVSRNVLTGSIVHLRVGGQVWGKGTVTGFTENYILEPLAIMDQLEIDEHVIVGYDVAFSASRVAIDGQSLVATGHAPSWPSGANSNEFLLNALNIGNMRADFVHQISGTIATAVGVKVASRNLLFAARAVVGEDVVFVAKRLISDVDL